MSDGIGKNSINEELVKSVETKAFATNAKNLGRNTLINFVGQVTVALSAIIMLPYIVRGLGYSAYGLLSLALMVFGSFSLLELGLGRATTKFVAEYLSNKEYSKISSVVWTSFTIQVVIGLVGGIMLALFSTTIASKMNLSKDMMPEAKQMILVLALSIPLILGSSAIRGALEGSQRFDLVNYVKIAVNISTYLIPLMGVVYNLSVPIIVFYMLIARFLATIAYFFCCIYTLPQIRNISVFKGIRISSLFSYAGWVAISNLVVPFLVQVDRYLIAALVTVASVTFYAVPFEILNGLWIIPGSIAAVLFPAFSGINNDDKNIKDLFVRPIKYILIILGPIILGIVAFSHDILFVWQGPILADKSSVVLKILVSGVLLNSLGWVPSNLLMGLGRPDVTAKIHLIQTPIYLGLAYYLILKWGIIGAAAAFTIRVTFEAVLIFCAAFYFKPGLANVLFKKTYPSFCALVFLSLLLITQKLCLVTSLLCNMLILLIILCFYSFTAWRVLLDKLDKELIMRLV